MLKTETLLLILTVVVVSLDPDDLSAQQTTDESAYSGAITQTRESNYQNIPRGLPQYSNRQRTAYSSAFSNYFQKANPEDRKLQAQVKSRLAQYQNADASKRSKLTVEIRGLLEKQFEERLKSPEQLILLFKEKLEGYSSILKLRQKKSDEIVSLRMSVLENEARGLGWSFLGKNTGNYGGDLDPGVPADALNAQFLPGVFASNREKLAPNPFVDPFGRNSSQSKGNKQSEILNDLAKLQDNEKKKVQLEKLRTLLQKEFEQQQGMIEDKIQAVKEKIVKVEKNVKGRREAKNAIIDLKLKTLINEAIGLGF